MLSFSIIIQKQNLEEEKYAGWLLIDGIWKALTLGGLRPWAWSHACISMDMEAGYYVVVINAIEVLNSSSKIEQHNLKEVNFQLQVGDISLLGQTYQSESSISNINIYADQLSINEMIEITKGDNCSLKGDYLAWDDMVFIMEGQTQILEDEHDICNIKDQPQYLFTEIFNEWDTCMYLCQKVNHGRVSSVANLKELQKMISWSNSIIGTDFLWLPYSDLAMENHWVDFYTGENMTADIIGP